MQPCQFQTQPQQYLFNERQAGVDLSTIGIADITFNQIKYLTLRRHLPRMRLQQTGQWRG